MGKQGSASRPWLGGALLVVCGCGAPDGGPPTLDPAAPGAHPQVPCFDQADPNELVSVYVVLSSPPAVAALTPEALRGSESSNRRVRARLREIEQEQAELRAHLVAQGAVVVAELRRLANAIQVQVPRSAVAAIEALAGVRQVELVPLYRPALAAAVPAIGAPSVWSPPTSATGEGIRIGIIDSGIDYNHAVFGGSGDPADYQANDPSWIEPGSFPTSKVVGGIDLAGDHYDPGDSEHQIPVPDADPLDCGQAPDGASPAGHGSHVAGIAAGGGVLLDGTPFAGPYDQSMDPSQFRIAPGVAPGASLHAIKVFGCSGGTHLVGAALEQAADPNQDGDFGDRLDVVNASIGTPFGVGSTTERQIISNLTALGTVVVAAGGNDGATFFAVDAPGIAPEAVSVAASAELELLEMIIREPPAIAGSVPAVEGDFTEPLARSGPIVASVVQVEPRDGCADLSNALALSGRIALLDRGGCTFYSKLLRLAQTQVLAAVVVDDEEAELPFAMGGSSPVELPGVLIRKVDGQRIESELAAGVILELDGTRLIEDDSGPQITDFSSRGPSAADSRLKPDLTAPGYGLDSARVGSGIDSRRANGTSAASPMVAGSMALLRQVRPTWRPEALKAALMNSASPLENDQGLRYPFSMAGAGQVDVASAVALEVTAAAAEADGAVSVSFGPIVALEPVEHSRRVLVENHGAQEVTLEVTTRQLHPLPGVAVAATPELLTVPGHGSRQILLSLAVDPVELGAPGPGPLTAPIQEGRPRHYLHEAAGTLELSDGADGQSLQLPWHAAVRGAAARAVVARRSCSIAGYHSEIHLELDGAAAHPEPVVSAFELGTVDPRHEDGADPEIARVDLLAVGAATNAATAESFADTWVHFGVAVAGQWTHPAQGGLSAVGIYVDTNFDGEAEFRVMAEPWDREGPYADVLVSRTYNRETNERVEPWGHVNLVAADELPTLPFHNGVLTLSAQVEAIGLTEDSPRFAYAAFALPRTSGVERGVSGWAEMDATRPVVDPARQAPWPGIPLFGPDALVSVEVDERARVEGAAPWLMLLHHANLPERRLELVPVGEIGSEGLVLEHQVDGAIERGELFTVRLTVRNYGSEAREGVALQGSWSGGSVSRIEAGGGGCALGPQLDCELGAVTPGRPREVLLEGVADEELGCGDAVVLELTMASADGCETGAAVELPIRCRSLAPAGGCGCRTLSGAPASDDGSRAGALALLLAVGARRRRRGCG